MKNITKIANAKLISKSQLKQIMGGQICPCDTPCPYMNQPVPKPCN